MSSGKCFCGLKLPVLLIAILLLWSATGHADGIPSIDIDSAYVGILGSSNVELTVSVTNLMSISSFDWAFSYDPQGLRLLFAEPIGALAAWEYFTYRYTQLDTCPEGCPSDLVQLTGIADLPNGEDPGAVYGLDGGIIRLVFRTTGKTLQARLD